MSAPKPLAGVKISSFIFLDLQKACVEAEEELKEQKKTLRACNDVSFVAEFVSRQLKIQNFILRVTLHLLLFDFQTINNKAKEAKHLENEKNANGIKLKEKEHDMVKLQKDTKDAAHNVNCFIF